MASLAMLQWGMPEGGIFRYRVPLGRRLLELLKDGQGGMVTPGTGLERCGSFRKLLLLQHLGC